MLQDEEYDSDTSDEDFVPEGVVESEDDAVSGGDEDDDEAEEGDEETTQKGKKKQRKKAKQKKSNGVEKEEEDESEKEKDKEENKKKEESIWADFLADVEDKPSPPPKPKKSSWGALLGNKKPSSSTDTTPAKPPPPAKKENNKESSSKQEKVKITQVFEFAGEEVRVEKEVDADSVEAQAAKCSATLSSQSSGTTTKALPGVGGIKRPGGLSGLVGLLDSKKQKLTTLEKTKLDWNNFKSDEGIDEELEKHKKSKDGYLDKQAFLERADLRQFEIERAMRMSKRSNR